MSGTAPSPTKIVDEFRGTEAELLDRLQAALAENAALKAKNAELIEGQHQMRLENARLIVEGKQDKLTGLFNRDAFDIAVERNVARYNRYQTPCSVLFFDADHFKWINDILGHPVGDTVLKKLAETLQSEFRNYDLVARFGGEEFVGIVEYCTLDRAIDKAQKIRRLVEAMEIEIDKDLVLNPKYADRDPSMRPTVIERDGRYFLKMTISIGAVTISSNQDNGETLKKKSDDALLQAKEEGRNCVCAYNPDGSITPISRTYNPEPGERSALPMALRRIVPAA